MMENVKKFWKILQVFSQKCESGIWCYLGVVGSAEKVFTVSRSILSTFFLGRRGWLGTFGPSPIGFGQKVDPPVKLRTCIGLEVNGNPRHVYIFWKLVLRATK